MPRTRFQRGDQAASDCTPSAEANQPLLAAQEGGNETISITTQQGQMAGDPGEISFSTASGDPGAEDLGAGSLFRCQLDITAIGSNQEVSVVFHAINDACASQGSVAMDEAVFTATGLQMATATWDPPAADRYEARILVAQGGMHTDGDETLTIRTNNADAFYEFPDAPVAASPIIPFIVPE